MELTTILQVSGIILNTVGVVLIFFFGLSPLVNTSGELFVSKNAETLRNSKGIKLKKYYASIANVGIVLCILGGGMQLAGLLV
ncbi:MAG: hypothetical protein RBR35_07115 [Salinivirgaceae bacterium]|nr:hypothetical protein [Salinivirgaceae bacterium]